MTGQELVDMIQRNCLLDKEIYIRDGNDNLFEIVEADTCTKRDPYDGDWDETVNYVALNNNCIVKEGE